MSKSTCYSFSRVALSLLFVTSICLPFADLVLGLDPTPPLSENRQLTTLPSLRSSVLAVLQQPAKISTWVELLRGILRYPQGFTLYYNDHFGFRRLLVRTHSRLVLLGWPAKGDVILGKQGWLFFGEARTRASYQADSLFTAQELEAWRSELEQQRDWLAARGSDLLVVIAPEKSTIYPELMPGNIPRLGSQTRLDQLLIYLADNSDLQVVDLRQALVQARTQHDTYYRTDTHWNGWGAFVAYREIIAKLAKSHPELAPKSEADFTFEEHDTRGGDLAGMLALKDAFHDRAVAVTPVSPLRARRVSTGLPDELNVAPGTAPQAWEIPDEGAPMAVVFRDSFANALIPFLSEHFRRTLYVTHYGIDRTVVLRECPAIVILEFAERELQRAVPLGSE